MVAYVAMIVLMIVVVVTVNLFIKSVMSVFVNLSIAIVTLMVEMRRMKKTVSMVQLPLTSKKMNQSPLISKKMSLRPWMKLEQLGYHI